MTNSDKKPIDFKPVSSLQEFTAIFEKYPNARHYIRNKDKKDNPLVCIGRKKFGENGKYEGFDGDCLVCFVGQNEELCDQFITALRDKK